MLIILMIATHILEYKHPLSPVVLRVSRGAAARAGCRCRDGGRGRVTKEEGRRLRKNWPFAGT
jgi:hypothetical protein